MRLLVVPLLLAALPAAAPLGAQTTAPAALPSRTVAVLPAARPAADTLAPRPTPTAAAADSGVAVAAAPAPAAEAAAARRTALEVGVGTVRFGGLVQAWYVDGPADRVTSTFRLRRAQLKFAGEISDRARWTLMLDLAKTLRVTDGRPVPATHVLQDAFVTFAAGPAAVDVGQFKLPLSYEGNVVPASRLETIERAAFIVDGRLALVRDLGVRAVVPIAGGRLHVGAFNGVGDGQNGQDADDRKVAVGRVELPPLLGVHLAASGAWSHGPGEERRDRAGADARLTVGPAMLRAEYMHAYDGAAEREGFYGLATYRVGDVELVGRFDSWDRDVRSELGAADLRERDWTAGVNYLVDGTNARLQANYVLRTYAGQPSAGMLLAAVQTAW